jgi:hypothetical protein
MRKYQGGALAARVERNGTLPAVNRAAVMRKSADLLTQLWEHHRRMMAGDFEFEPALLRALAGYATFYSSSRTERPILAGGAEGAQGLTTENTLNHAQGVVVGFREKAGELG